MVYKKYGLGSFNVKLADIIEKHEKLHAYFSRKSDVNMVVLFSSASRKKFMRGIDLAVHV